MSEIELPDLFKKRFEGSQYINGLKEVYTRMIKDKDDDVIKQIDIFLEFELDKYVKMELDGQNAGQNKIGDIKTPLHKIDENLKDSDIEQFKSIINNIYVELYNNEGETEVKILSPCKEDDLDHMELDGKCVPLKDINTKCGGIQHYNKEAKTCCDPGYKYDKDKKACYYPTISVGGKKRRKSKRKKRRKTKRRKRNRKKSTRRRKRRRRRRTKRKKRRSKRRRKK